MINSLLFSPLAISGSARSGCLPARLPSLRTIVDIRGSELREVVGFLKIAGVSVEIRPKFLDSGADAAWRRALWAIIAHIEDRPPLGEPTPPRLSHWMASLT